VTTTTFLEMHSPADVRAPEPPAGVAIRRVDPPDPALNARLYAAVGSAYRWVDRLRWSPEDWRRYVTDPDLETWLMTDGDTPAGYFELAAVAPVAPTGASASLADARGVSSNVEIAYFGLLPGYLGRGLGAALLGAAAHRGWALSPNRVWLHTSSHDHPHALANYLARGFRIFRVDVS
jgi:GNAT superfamily N-acetyltransferase